MNIWYTRNPLVWVLWPLTLLFTLIASIRRYLYRLGIKKQHRLDAIVIVVGNISVGGNGKTPLVQRLAEILRQQGYHPGVLSRGYGGKGVAYPHSVQTNDDPAQVGDEPLMLRQHLQCPLVVDPDRVRGAQYLIDQYQCNIILCDDGLQHYRLARDIEIAVMDGKRRLGNGYLLPMGPLREPAWRLQQVDFVIINGGDIQRGEYPMSLESGRLVNIKQPTKSLSVSEISQPVIALAGIGNPQRFFDLLQRKAVPIAQCLSFADHHKFRPSEVPDGQVLMTEKDAIKCRSFARDDWWYLPVSAKLSDDFKTKFLQRIKGIQHGIR